MSSSLESAIARLYDVFGAYRAPTSSSHSPYSTITDDEVAALRRTPIAKLQGRDLTTFAMSALTTWGDEDEFRHYLPRLCELAVTESGWVEVATLLGKLDTGRWRGWPTKEQDAIQSFFDEAWDASLQGETKASFATIALGASNAGIAIEPLTKRASEPTKAWALQMANLITLERKPLLQGNSLRAKWSPEARTALLAMIRAPETRRRLEDVFVENLDPTDSTLIGEALEVLGARVR